MSEPATAGRRDVRGLIVTKIYLGRLAGGMPLAAALR
jgi:hypothetical protein